MNEPRATIAPFRTCPGAYIVAPCSARLINKVRDYRENLDAGVTSLRRQSITLRLALDLVGSRKPREKATTWCARAQLAMNMWAAHHDNIEVTWEAHNA